MICMLWLLQKLKKERTWISVWSLKNTPDSSNYTYGAVLVNEQAYRANIEIDSNGTKNGTSLIINGVKVIDKFDINASNYKSKLTKNELQKEIQTLIGAGNGSLAIGETGQKNLSLTTSELPEGHYYLFAGAYDPKRKIAGLTQSESEITICLHEHCLLQTSQAALPAVMLLFLSSL